MTPSFHCTMCLGLCLCIVLLVQDMIMNQEQQYGGSNPCEMSFEAI